MIFRVIAVTGGLACAAGLSQFPEYSQQYTQRLSGAVDELSGVVVQFDADAESLGLSRDAALAELALGSRMAQARAQSMGQVLERHARLSADLAALKGSTNIQKALNPLYFSDADVARAAWGDFKPAVPVTPEGLGFAGVGFVAGYGLLVGLMAGLGRVFRRKERPQAAEA
ncbi:DUF2937 family protein [Roseovarius sp. A21]|uniref:DUF2937 family protein n=1 Tax=Roseovarius bejariae TaxID=2576383 RepID=A0A844CHX8_9RHOB|nr:DUF2937 family protein [Roseovarius bejariae]MRU14257.1 DUF2937 family protein [Roseovarius bejariae]